MAANSAVQVPARTEMTVYPGQIRRDIYKPSGEKVRLSLCEIPHFGCTHNIGTMAAFDAYCKAVETKKFKVSCCNFKVWNITRGLYINECTYGERCSYIHTGYTTTFGRAIMALTEYILANPMANLSFMSGEEYLAKFGFLKTVGLDNFISVMQEVVREQIKEKTAKEAQEAVEEARKAKAEKEAKLSEKAAEALNEFRTQQKSIMSRLTFPPNHRSRESTASPTVSSPITVTAAPAPATPAPEPVAVVTAPASEPVAVVAVTAPEPVAVVTVTAPEPVAVPEEVPASVAVVAAPEPVAVPEEVPAAPAPAPEPVAVVTAPEPVTSVTATEPIQSEKIPEKVVVSKKRKNDNINTPENLVVSKNFEKVFKRAKISKVPELVKTLAQFKNKVLSNASVTVAAPPAPIVTAEATPAVDVTFNILVPKVNSIKFLALVAKRAELAKFDEFFRTNQDEAIRNILVEKLLSEL